MIGKSPASRYKSSSGEETAPRRLGKFCFAMNHPARFFAVHFAGRAALKCIFKPASERQLAQKQLHFEAEKGVVYGQDDDELRFENTR